MGVYLGEQYMEVEYIQSTATSPGSTSSSGQYIDSLVTINKNIKIEIDIQFTSTATQSRLFGCGYDSGSSGITFDAYINGSTQWARGTANGTGNRQTTSISANTNRNKFILDNSRYIIYNAGGTEVYNATNSATITNSDTWTIPLLARLNKTENKICQHSSAKLYSCKIWDSGTLVRDFIPCYRKSDNEIGLFDKVGNKFYANSGTGTFTKGNDVKLVSPQLKNAYIGMGLVQIFDFSTSDTHGFTKYTSAYNGLTIDTTNQWCCNTTSGSGGYGSFYKQVNYKKCWQRIKARSNVSSGFSAICGIGNNYAPSSGFSCSIGFDGDSFFIGIKGQSSYYDVPFPSGFDKSQYHYYDTIWDNGSVTVKVLNLDETVVWSNTYTASETTQKYIGFSGGYGSSTRGFDIKEYRLAYEE